MLKLTRRQRYIAGAALFWFACHHLVLLVWHTEQSVGPLNSVVYHYVNPVFNQQFRIMGPQPPDRSIRLYFRVPQAGDWTEWTDPCYSVLARHHRNRFSANWRRYYRHLHLTYEIYDQAFYNDGVIDQELYDQAVKSIAHCCQDSFEGDVELALVEIKREAAATPLDNQHLKIWRVRHD